MFASQVGIGYAVTCWNPGEDKVKTAALIVAAGRGSRAGADTPKQYLEIAGKSVLRRSIEAMAVCPSVASVTVVIHPDDAERYADATQGTFTKLRRPATGGATRQASVRLGLQELREIAPDSVLIHDAARPFVPPAVVERVVGALRTHIGALAALPVQDTLKREAPGGLIAATVDRSGLWQAQTPQGFHYASILSAHERAAAQGLDDFTDDAAIAEWAGLDVQLVLGSPENRKITTSDDVVDACRRLESTMGMGWEPRTGTGFDVHRFAPGDSVWLCGVRIPHHARLEGHSDADVALHALTDALLGAIGDGDIGQHFPPSDPRWKGAASRLFLADAARRVAERGGRIVNVDVTLLCEAPRIGPHRPRMQAEVAEILGISSDRVGIKATTTEGLGFTGRGEGIAAMANALVLLPIA